MPLLSSATLRANLILSATAAGAPGGLAQGITGTYNPVHELLGSFADAVAPLINTAASTAVWTPAAPFYPGTIPIPVIAPSGAFAPVVKTLPAIVPPQHLGLAQAQASALGWIGTHRAVLFHGIFGGLYTSLASSPQILGSLTPLDIFQTGSFFTYVAPPLVPSVVAQATIAAFLANPRLGVAGDPSRRVILATQFAQIASQVWGSVTPVVSAGLISPGPIPLPVPVVYLP